MRNSYKNLSKIINGHITLIDHCDLYHFVKNEWNLKGK